MLACALIASVTGCGGGRIYKPSNLPAEYLAAKMDNPQTIDLSRLAGATVSSEMIDRGDVLDVTIESGYGGDTATTYPVRVGEDGLAQVPLIGRVALAGLETEACEQAIASAAVERQVFRSPNVTVAMRRQRFNKVTVLGAVEKPGVYELPRGTSSLLTALVSAGGLAKNAGSDVEIRRPATRAVTPPKVDRMATTQGNQPASYHENVSTANPGGSFKINLVSATQQAGSTVDLSDGDVVMVDIRDPQPVHVIGLVNKPGQFDLPANQDLRMLDVIAMAGGQSSMAANKVHVIRHVAGKDEPVVIEVSLHEAKRQGNGNLRLSPGDVVSIEQTPATVVTDAVKNFVRFTIGSNVSFF